VIYRPDIDGLRAVAVAVVVGYHAFPQIVPGGFVGVDVFFVISGFLITQLILNDLLSKRFSLSGFYARRVRRVFPALIVILLASFALGWLLLLPDEFASLGTSTVGAAAFVANIVFFHQAGYFDIAAAYKPLLHLWSLGIEEQFYIVWPWILLLAFRRGHGLFWLILALGLASFAVNLAIVHRDPAAAFYLPHARSWELLMGCLIACVSLQGAPAWLVARLDRIDRILWAGIAARLEGKAERLAHDAKAWLGIALIVGAVAFLHHNSTFPGWRALLPTLGTCLIICAEDSWLNRVVMSHRAAIFLGLISYPLYLWHWPLLSFARYAETGSPSPLLTVSCVLASVALAWATYVFLERPIRFGRPARIKVVSLAALMAAAGCIGLLTVAAGGFDIRIPEAMRDNFRDISRARVDPEKDWRLGTCLLETQHDKSKFADACLDREPRPSILVWGDSVAAALYPGLRHAQASHPFAIGQFTIAGCPPILGLVIPTRPHCKDSNDFVSSLIAR
jgi:peptidoglycan/LPS O-acetylase OafA/YrhL